VGWENFYNVLTAERMHDSIGRLFQYLLFGACLEVFLGTVLALILYELIKKEWLRITLLIFMVMPMMLPPSIVGVLWKFLLQAYNGAVNHLFINFGFLGPMERIEWLGIDYALISVTIADLWQWTALPLLIVYSGRGSLPPAIYEAAKVDGASGWLVLRRITLPMLKEIIAIAFIPIKFFTIIINTIVAITIITIAITYPVFIATGFLSFTIKELTSISRFFIC